jgi:signal transduction histidine kinase
MRRYLVGTPFWENRNAKKMQRTRIIFIDDEIHFLDGLKRMFHPYRNLWDFVFSTDQGVVLSRVAEDRDTVVVSDLMMPGMDGIELCAQVRKVCAANTNSSTYFLLLSNVRDTENKTLGLESGADDYVEKPFKPEELLARIKIGIRMLDARTALREARKKAEERSAAKSDAIAHLSHEIRNPMNAILGMSSLLLESELPVESMEMVQTIHSASEGLLHLLNDVLDISKVEAGKFELDTYEFDLESMIRDVVELSGIPAREKGISVTYGMPDEEIGLLMGDAKRLRQVLINLVSNGIKFTSHGSVHMGIQVEKNDRSYMRLAVRVVDTGIGIPEEKQGKLFEAFAQADVATQTRFGGTGLGLALSKQIVQMMGGELTLKSEEGRGTTFSFSILLGKSENARRKQTPQSAYAPIIGGDRLWVLVADDNIVNRKVASMMIKKLGANADTAEDGSEVLLKMKERYFDMILMDVEMPGLNGIETTRIIRSGSMPMKNEAPRIITFTGHAMKEDEPRYLEAGMDGVLTKPLRPEDLKNEILRILAQRS